MYAIRPYYQNHPLLDIPHQYKLINLRAEIGGFEALKGSTVAMDFCHGHPLANADVAYLFKEAGANLHFLCGTGKEQMALVDRFLESSAGRLVAASLGGSTGAILKATDDHVDTVKDKMGAVDQHMKDLEARFKLQNNMILLI